MKPSKKPNTDFQAHVERINHLMLDKIELVLDVFKRKDDPPPPLTPLGAGLWRWINNRLDLQNFCNKPACRRAHLCKGDPRACLTRHASKIPPTMAKQVVALGRVLYPIEAQKRGFTDDVP